MRSPTNNKHVNTSIQRVSQKVPFPGPEAFVPLKPVSDNFGLLLESKMNRKTQCYRVSIEKANNYLGLMETYNWRTKTSLPIVRCFYTNVVANHSNLAVIQVFNQYCPQRLSDLPQITLPQALYLLKESLYGFQRLWHKFGSFKLTSKMIALNEQQRCKVWINQNFSLNTKDKSDITESDFLQCLFSIFQQKVAKNESTKNFFRETLFCKNFMKAFKIIDSTASSEKIKIPFKFDAGCPESRMRRLAKETVIPMKTSITQTFTQSGNLSIQRNKSHNEIVIKNSHRSVYNPTPQRDLSSTGRINQSVGINLSQTLIGKSLLNRGNQSTTTNNDEQYPDPETPLRKMRSKRVKGSLFMSGSMDAEIIPINKKVLTRSKQSVEDEVKVKDFNTIAKCELAESYVLSPLVLSQLKTSLNSNEKVEHLESNEDRDAISQEENDEVVMDINPILAKNGWQFKIGNLLGNNTSIKSSIVEGKEVRMDYSSVRLLKLEALGNKHIVNSILPGDMDF